MSNFTNVQLFKTVLPKKLVFLLIGLFVFEVVITILIIYFLSINQIRTQLDEKIKHAQEDIYYTNGKWDLNLYNNDPSLLGVYPLYVITTGGFILDRRDPIQGFLDTTDYKRLLSYEHIQTVTTFANQTRRVYSQPLYYKGEIIGVIAVGYYNPKQQLLENIDEKLVATLNQIKSEIKTNNGIINATTVDQRMIPYDISYTIVDSYNTLITKNANVNNINRIPNFIDPSYVETQLDSHRERLVQDQKTSEFFLIESNIIQNRKGAVLGFITIGQSLQPLLTFLLQYIIWQVLGYIIIFFVLLFILQPYFKLYLLKVKEEKSPIKALFNENIGALIVNNKKIIIPYATNQFYMLQALFHKPSKRWETDELLKKFGENENANGRKVYDTMIKINSKFSAITSKKLILNQNKTYYLNDTVIVLKKQNESQKVKLTQQMI